MAISFNTSSSYPFSMARAMVAKVSKMMQVFMSVLEDCPESIDTVSCISCILDLVSGYTSDKGIHKKYKPTGTILTQVKPSSFKSLREPIKK